MQRQSWESFRGVGLLLWVNHLLHLFGWCIVFAYDDKTGKLREVYPARTSSRGFSEEEYKDNYVRLTRYIAREANQLLSEVEE